MAGRVVVSETGHPEGRRKREAGTMISSRAGKRWNLNLDGFWVGRERTLGPGPQPGKISEALMTGAEGLAGFCSPMSALLRSQNGEK